MMETSSPQPTARVGMVGENDNERIGPSKCDVELTVISYYRSTQGKTTKRCRRTEVLVKFKKCKSPLLHPQISR